MLNNEFRLIGTVVSEFEEIGSENFSKKKFFIEVDRKNNKTAVQHPVLVFGSNRDIDTTMSYVGKLVIINGYIDTFKSYVSLIAQDMIVVGAVEETEAPDIVPEESTGLPIGDDTEKTDIEEIYGSTKPSKELEVTDDDLPF